MNNNNGFLDIKPQSSAIQDVETSKHDRMKLFARKLLFYMGIPSKNIREEETINFRGHRYRVDIVGYPGKYNQDESNPLAIAIECGDNKAEKIDALRNTFALVLILPYKEFDILEQPEIKLIQRMTKDLEQQTISNYHYLKEIKSIQQQYTETEKLLTKQIEEIGINLTKKIDIEGKAKIEMLERTLLKYEKELALLSEFKDWCFKFGRP